MNSGRWLGYAAAFGAVLVFGLATGACEVKFNCGGTGNAPTVLEGAKLEPWLADWLAAERDLKVTVACPKDRPMKSGDSFTCEATTDDGMSVPITVIQKDGEGNLKMEITGIFIDTTKAFTEIKAKLSASAVITCPSRKLYLKQVGDTASCDVRDGDERAKLVIRATDTEAGRVHMEVVPSTP